MKSSEALTDSILRAASELIVALSSQFNTVVEAASEF